MSSSSAGSSASPSSAVGEQRQRQPTHHDNSSSNNNKQQHRPKRIQAPSNTACDAYRKDYVTTLERRIEHAERLLRKLSVSTGVDLVAIAHDAGQDGGELDEARIDDAVSLLKQANLAALVEQQGIDQYNDARQHEARDSEQDHTVRSPLDRRDTTFEFGHARFSGPSSNPMFVTQVVNDFNMTKNLGMGQGTQSVVDRALTLSEFESKVFRHPLPPFDLVQVLINNFFKHVNAVWPLLHRPSFDRHLAQGLAGTNPSFRSLLFVMLAVAARSSDDSRLHGTFSHEAFYVASCIDAPPHVIRPSSIFYLQASMIGIGYALSSEQSTRAWLSTGLALRHFVDLGAHVESSPTWKASPMLDQLRKRSFHALLFLDRQMSMGIGRPSTLSPRDFNLDYPLSITDEALDAWDKNPSAGPPPTVPGAVMGFEWNSRLSDIIYDACTDLYPSRPLTGPETFAAANKIRRKAIAWEQEVPECLRWSDDVSSVDDAMLMTRAQMRCSAFSVKILTLRTLVLTVARTKANMDALGPCFAVGRITLSALTRIFQTIMDRNLLPQSCGWLPTSASYALTIYFSIMRASRLSYPFLKRTSGELHTVLRALRLLSSTTPEARWVYHSALRIVPLCNQWRAGEGIDYVKVLLNNGPFDGSVFDRLQASVSSTPITAEDDKHCAMLNPADSLLSSVTPTQLAVPPFAFEQRFKSEFTDSLPQGLTLQDIQIDVTGRSLPTPSISDSLSPETLALLSQATESASNGGPVFPELVSTADLNANSSKPAPESPQQPQQQQQQQQKPVQLPFLSAQFFQTGINELMSMDTDDMPQALFEGTGQFEVSAVDEHPWFTDDYLQNFFNTSDHQSFAQ
ncbi:protein phosphatase regulatory subunit Sds22 [Microbotryomycetes sp. JL201]|nr:protein phosphatase regulatory subunit Sds22 [Microbotryomycetes sp. JL201]